MQTAREYSRVKALRILSTTKGFLSSHGIGRRWFWVICALGGLCLTLASLSVAVGLTFHQHALSSLNMREQDPSAGRDAGLALRAALLFDPDNAGYWYHQSILLFGDDACRQRDKYCAKAIESLANAVRLHPIWAFAWARLAALYADDRQFPQAMHALRNAVRFGQYENLVRHTVIAIGLAYWDQIDIDARSFLSARLEAMLDHDELFVARAVDRLAVRDGPPAMFDHPDLRARYLVARSRFLAQRGARRGR